MLFSIGNVYELMLKEKLLKEFSLSQFDNQNFLIIEAGKKQVVLVYDGELKELNNVRIHHKYKCEVTGQTQLLVHCIFIKTILKIGISYQEKDIIKISIFYLYLICNQTLYWKHLRKRIARS